MYICGCMSSVGGRLTKVAWQWGPGWTSTIEYNKGKRRTEWERRDPALIAKLGGMSWLQGECHETGGVPSEEAHSGDRG